MRDDLLAYYQRELIFLRQMGAEFAEKYPKIASRLILNADGSGDPHVERLLEAFAFLAARVHLKIDDDFPEITDALLGVLYPHYLRPIPSMTVVEFFADPEQGTPPEGLTVPQDSVLYSGAIEGAPCKFKTCYDTTLWPIEITGVNWTTPDRLQPQMQAQDTVAALRIELRCPLEIGFDKLRMPALRFFLNGGNQVVYDLYELLCSNCTRILVRDPRSHSRIKPIELPVGSLRPFGFAEEEGVLPYPRRSFLGYRLLQEYFAFPEKFLFLELTDFSWLPLSGLKDRIEFVFLISPFDRRQRQKDLEVGISETTIRLGCSPVVNLFSHDAEPIQLAQTQFEYLVSPDNSRRKSMEVFSVDQVSIIDPRQQTPIVFEPLYSYRYGAPQEKKQTYWRSARRASISSGDDETTDVWLSLADRSGLAISPNVDTLQVAVTCTNGDVPSRMPFGSSRGDLDIQGSSAVKKVTILIKPTKTIRPPTGEDAMWRLLSHLSLNYLSLVSEGKEALQKILILYNFAGSVESERQIRGISQIKSQHHFARVVSENGISFARGTRVEIEFDEDQFVGGGVYLFASVLENFLGLYTSINSFTELIAKTIQRKEELKHWPPRAGGKILV